MDFRMAVQTRTAEHTICRGIALEVREIGVDGPGMLGYVMATLAKLRRPADQKLSMIAAMSGMAGLAIFLNRRMFPEKGSALFRVTFIAEFINGPRHDHLLSETTMLVMTARALHSSLTDGMVRLLGNLAADAAVAGNAKIGL
jgi:hypothetical protein